MTLRKEQLAVAPRGAVADAKPTTLEQDHHLASVDGLQRPAQGKARQAYGDGAQQVQDLEVGA